MGLDRFIRWGPPPEWGPPTLERLASVARDFLGERWRVTTDGECWIACECDDKQTFALRSERTDPSEGRDKTITAGEGMHRAYQDRTRGFEIFFLVEDGKIDQTSVITRQADEFTGALADQYGELIARWWNGTMVVDGQRRVWVDEDEDEDEG